MACKISKKTNESEWVNSKKSAFTHARTDGREFKNQLPYFSYEYEPYESYLKKYRNFKTQKNSYRNPYISKFQTKRMKKDFWIP